MPQAGGSLEAQRPCLRCSQLGCAHKSPSGWAWLHLGAGGGVCELLEAYSFSPFQSWLPLAEDIAICLWEGWRW